MADFIKETVTTNVERSTPEASGIQTVEYVIYFLLGFLEILLAFRLLLKMMGASLSSGFVRIIYSLTALFIMPFEGIFRRGFTEGIETTSVFEPSALVAMVVYALLAWGIVQFVRILSGKKQIQD